MFDEDEAGRAWVRCGREGLLDGCVMVDRAACGSVVICMEGVGREVGDGVVASVGGWVMVWRVITVREYDYACWCGGCVDGLKGVCKEGWGCVCGKVDPCVC